MEPERLARRDAGQLRRRLQLHEGGDGALHEPARGSDRQRLVGHGRARLDRGVELRGLQGRDQRLHALLPRSSSPASAFASTRCSPASRRPRWSPGSWRRTAARPSSEQIPLRDFADARAGRGDGRLPRRPRRELYDRIPVGRGRRSQHDGRRRRSADVNCREHARTRRCAMAMTRVRASRGRAGGGRGCTRGERGRGEPRRDAHGRSRAPSRSTCWTSCSASSGARA